MLPDRLPVAFCFFCFLFLVALFCSSFACVRACVRACVCACFLCCSFLGEMGWGGVGRGGAGRHLCAARFERHFLTF